MISRVFSCSFSLILVFCLVPGFAQTHTPTPAQPKTASVAPASAPAVPIDPKELMLQAAKVNGLRGIDGPWHIKAKYQTFDADGKPENQGTFDEWRVGSKTKVSYSSSHFHQTLYLDGEKRLITGDDGWVPVPETMVTKYLDDPTPREAAIEKESYSVVDKEIGTVALTCLRPKPAAPNTQLLPTICLNRGSEAVRLQSNWGGLYVEFNDIVLVNGQHYVAKRISVENSKQPIVNVNMITLDFPAKLTDADVTAPASARMPPFTMSYPGMKAGHRTQWTFVNQPYSTRGDHGTVMLEATITAHGDVEDIKVISGPSEFRNTAIENIRTWKFTPFTHNGRPVAVRIGLNMKF